VDVVLVEDNEVFRTGLARALRRRPDVGRVTEAGDGAAGLEAARGLHPDVVVVDDRMPGLGGLDVLRAVAADPALRDVPVVLLSADVSPDLRRDALRAGATGTLDKAVSRREIGDAVVRVAQAGRTPAGRSA
jgi:DNA-binding NarL/FixJ family response regulator